MVTTVERLVPSRVTLTLVPSGSQRCAAVSASGRNTAPLAVRRPASWSPYQEATPYCGGRLGGGGAIIATASSFLGGITCSGTATPMATTRHAATTAPIAPR